jgi:hypothetical protein
VNLLRDEGNIARRSGRGSAAVPGAARISAAEDRGNGCALGRCGRDSGAL